MDHDAASATLPAPVIRADGLQIDEHRQFQQRFWTAQRYAWGVAGMVVILALCGLTGGGGPLSRQTLRIGSTEIDVPRIARWTADEDIRLRFGAGSGTHRVMVGPEALDHLRFVGGTPAAVTQSSSHKGLALGFETGTGAVDLHFRTTRPGMFSLELTVDGVGVPAGVIVLP